MADPKEPCPCGSGKRYARCCLERDRKEKRLALWSSLLLIPVLSGIVFYLWPSRGGPVQDDPAEDGRQSLARQATTPLPPAVTQPPSPWQYDPVKNQHWNPDHQHWHTGKPPENIAGTPEATPPEFHDFALPDLQGRISSAKDFAGKVLLINFWATWCGPCRKEIPDLAELYKRYGARGVEILGVAVDDSGEQVVKPFVEKVPINYKILIGSPKLLATYDFKNIPVTLVLDRQGKVQRRLVGAQSLANLEAAIKPLL